MARVTLHSSSDSEQDFFDGIATVVEVGGDLSDTFEVEFKKHVRSEAAAILDALFGDAALDLQASGPKRDGPLEIAFKMNTACAGAGADRDDFLINSAPLAELFDELFDLYEVNGVPHFPAAVLESVKSLHVRLGEWIKAAEESGELRR